MAGRKSPLFKVPSTRLRDQAIALLTEHQAEDILCRSTQGIADYTDYFVLASGRSSRHQRALAETLRTGLKTLTGFAPAMESDTEAVWVVLDYGDLVLHLQTRSTRDYYDLEGLWFAPADETEDTLATNGQEL